MTNTTFHLDELDESKVFPVIEQEKLERSLVNYVRLLARQHPFTQELKVDERRIAAQLHEFWPSIEGWEEAAAQVITMIADFARDSHVVTYDHEKMLRIEVGRKDINPSFLPVANEYTSVASFDATDGLMRRCVVPPSDEPPSLDDLSVSSGMVVICQPIIASYRDVVVGKGVGRHSDSGITIYGERVRDQALIGNVESDKRYANMYVPPNHPPPTLTTTHPFVPPQEAQAAGQEQKPQPQQQQPQQNPADAARAGLVGAATGLGALGAAEAALGHIEHQRLMGEARHLAHPSPHPQEGRRGPHLAEVTEVATLAQEAVAAENEITALAEPERPYLGEAAEAATVRSLEAEEQVEATLAAETVVAVQRYEEAAGHPEAHYAETVEAPEARYAEPADLAETEYAESPERAIAKYAQQAGSAETRYAELGERAEADYAEGERRPVAAYAAPADLAETRYAEPADLAQTRYAEPAELAEVDYADRERRPVAEYAAPADLAEARYGERPEARYSEVSENRDSNEDVREAARGDGPAEQQRAFEQGREQGREQGGEQSNVRGGEQARAEVSRAEPQSGREGPRAETGTGGSGSSDSESGRQSVEELRAENHETGRSQREINEDRYGQENVDKAKDKMKESAEHSTDKARDQRQEVVDRSAERNEEPRHKESRHEELGREEPRGDRDEERKDGGFDEHRRDDRDDTFPPYHGHHISGFGHEQAPLHQEDLSRHFDHVREMFHNIGGPHHGFDGVSPGHYVRGPQALPGGHAVHAAEAREFTAPVYVGRGAQAVGGRPLAPARLTPLAPMILATHPLRAQPAQANPRQAHPATPLHAQPASGMGQQFKKLLFKKKLAEAKEAEAAPNAEGEIQQAVPIPTPPAPALTKE